MMNFFEREVDAIRRKTDSMFARLMLAQWLGAILAAVWISPATWAGDQPSLHLHVWMAVILGGAITLFPVFLAARYPGRVLTRHVVAAGQVLMSALLIHLTGGRIETHFHVFGSLAFLAFYRDWRILMTATVVVGLDHFIRGIYWPESVYGVAVAAPWRALEHAGWVLFEVSFLTLSIRQNLKALQVIADRQHRLELEVEQRLEATEAVRRAQGSLEERVRQRTIELASACDALRESEERYRQLIESSPEAVLVELDGKISFANGAFCRLVGASSPAEIVGRSALDFVHPEAVGSVTERIRILGEKQEPLPLGEAKIRRLDGKSVDVEVVACPVKASGKNGAQIILRDVTDRKLLESQLRQSQKMEAVGRLAGGVAHDFNNLLTAILGYSQLLMPRLKDREELQKDLKEIRNAAERAAGLTRQLLAFSRRQDLQPRVLNLNEVVTQSRNILRRIIGEDIEFITRLSPRLGCIRADPGQLEQALMNLVVNARDAMARGGRLTLETSDVTLDDEFVRTHVGSKPGRHVLLTVTDTGCGMSKDVLAHAFEPFFTTKPQGKGTGLGLSTVYGIVKQSGGSLWIDSSPGEGTSVKIYLPFVDEPAEPERKRTEAISPKGSETVLVVEDEEAVRQLARRVLEAGGYRVLAAADPAEALRILQTRKETIELILTDMVMPLMNGLDLAERVKAIRPTMKVVFMSGYSGSTIFDRDRSGAPAAFILKPFTPEGLSRIVRQTLDAAP